MASGQWSASRIRRKRFAAPPNTVWTLLLDYLPVTYSFSVLHVPPVGELLADIDSVTLDDVREVAEAVLSAPPTLAVIGPFDSERQFASAVS